MFLGYGEFGYRPQQLETVAERRNADLFEVVIREIGQKAKLRSFSAKRCAYCPRPSFSSQSATCCIEGAPWIMGFIRPHRQDYLTNP